MPHVRECKWTQDICKFTCIPREGKWGLVLRFLDQAPWVRRAKERVSENYRERHVWEGERRDVGCHHSSQHSRTLHIKVSAAAKAREGAQWKNGLHWHMRAPRAQNAHSRIKWSLQLFCFSLDPKSTYVFKPLIFSYCLLPFSFKTQAKTRLQWVMQNI